MADEAKTMKIALIQFEGELGNVPANRDKAVKMIAEAAANGADMVVLPELFSTGYHLNTIGPDIIELTESVDGPTVAALQAAAREGNCYVVAGLSLYHDLPGVPYNSAVFINRDGSLQGTMDKVHLWALERFYFRAGCEFPVFETEFGKVGIMICYDMGFPEAARMMALNGAELILCPSAWCVEDKDIWEINVPARALENTVFLAAVNRFGHEGGDLYMHGGSMVCGPRGQKIAQLEEEREGILYVDLDMSLVAKNRVMSPYLRDRRPDTYEDMLLWP